MPLLKYQSTPQWLQAPRRRMIEKLPVRTMRKALYLMMIRKPGNFTDPTTFNEKVNWRIFNDRRDRIVKACDKLWMKEMAREAFPGAELRIPKTYWSGTDLRDAPDLTTLPPWVLKPNASSGHALFGPGPDTDLDDLIERTRTWFTETPLELGEWGYSAARTQYLLEERIPTPDGQAPVDYKFFVFNGRIELIQVNRGRFAKEQTTTFLDADWRTLPVKWRIQPVGAEDRPVELDKMMEIARILGRDWDFIRIDLYAVDGEVWFGEYTPYPGSGLLRYKPMTFDLEQGRQWQLPTLAEVQPGCP